MALSCALEVASDEIYRRVYWHAGARQSGTSMTRSLFRRAKSPEEELFRESHPTRTGKTLDCHSFRTVPQTAGARTQTQLPGSCRHFIRRNLGRRGHVRRRQGHSRWDGAEQSRHTRGDERRARPRHHKRAASRLLGHRDKRYWDEGWAYREGW